LPRVRLVTAVIALLAGAAVLTFGWMPPGPPRINIRWTPDTTDQGRVAAEGALRLMSPIRREDRTWSYVLLDTSGDHVRQVVQHPAVEDRAYIGPGNTLTPDAPWLRARFQARYRRAPVRWLAAL